MTLDYFYGQAGELFSFFRIPKALFQEQQFQDLSTDAKTLYGILLDRMSLSVKNEWFDKKGRVFIIFTIEDAATFLGVIALVALAAGSGFYVFMKQKQKKQAEKEALDPDADYTEDKGDFEIPVEDEPDADEAPDEQNPENS